LTRKSVLSAGIENLFSFWWTVFKPAVRIFQFDSSSSKIRVWIFVGIHPGVTYLNRRTSSIGVMLCGAMLNVTSGLALPSKASCCRTAYIRALHFVCFGRFYGAAVDLMNVYQGKV